MLISEVKAAIRFTKRAMNPSTKLRNKTGNIKKRRKESQILSPELTCESNFYFIEDVGLRLSQRRRRIIHILYPPYIGKQCTKNGASRNRYRSKVR